MITLHAPDGVGEVSPGDDLAALLLASTDACQDGDIVLVTSKVVSKAEGRILTGTRDDALPGQTRRVVARRGPTVIVRNLLGLTMAAAGIDASNVEAGRVLLLPEDPDASARRLRAAIRERTGVNVGVIVTDTAGRAWRTGQTDIAIGAAGIRVVEEFAGRTDAHGNPLLVTAPAVADELAGAAELASGKLGGRPFVVVRGRADLVLDAGEHGTGASVLIRAEGDDLFGYGAREAVRRAVSGDAADRAPFGPPLTADDLAAELTETVAGLDVDRHGDEVEVRAPDAATAARARVLAYACGWQSEAGHPTRLRLRPATA
ncbi:coenzyme F420-0:L-glutamate ligase [Nocardioides limicola]|uniref:coenzyme F420-0:L-glutamate ligase n=1 Tax=Nocardioides limicola TaxID=2803368 RepID=UPI00193B6052|nr:coenzyme F420-0:L-glutamate ligase [Nocardioides sp. DJM-14]